MRRSPDGRWRTGDRDERGCSSRLVRQSGWREPTKAGISGSYASCSRSVSKASARGRRRPPHPHRSVTGPAGDQRRRGRGCSLRTQPAAERAPEARLELADRPGGLRSARRDGNQGDGPPPRKNALCGRLEGPDGASEARVGSDLTRRCCFKKVRSLRRRWHGSGAGVPAFSLPWRRAHELPESWPGSYPHRFWPLRRTINRSDPILYGTLQSTRSDFRCGTTDRTQKTPVMLRGNPGHAA